MRRLVDPGRSAGASGALLIALASVLWGTTGTAASLLPADVSPLFVGAATMGIGGVLLLITTPRGVLALLRDRTALGWLGVGAGSVFVYPLAFYSGMDFAGVAIGTVVALGSAPIFAAALEVMIERRAPGWPWRIGTGFALLGMILLIGGGGVIGQNPAVRNTGIILGLLAGASYAVYTYGSVRLIARGHSARSVMGAVFGFGAILLMPLVLVLGAQHWSDPATMPIVAYLALGPMFLAYLLFGQGLRTVGSSSATTITLIEPVVATLLAVTVVGEQLSATAWVGLALIMAGVAPVMTARRPRFR